MKPSLDLALIGNCTVGALIDRRAEIAWTCLPRFDGDPFFCSLLRDDDGPAALGGFRIDLEAFDRAEQHYVDNTAILTTRLFDQCGGCVEVTDFAPRFGQYGRMFRPMMLVRRLKRIAGSPRVTLRLRPACAYGADTPLQTWGSNHVRYITPHLTVRVTTDVSITALLQESPFFLEDSATLLVGPDESVHDSPEDVGRRFLEETTRYWHEWTRFLNIPFEWQDAVIRAAITLKLNAYDDTGAIIAAMTTSIPEAPDSGRNWDYRYCWLRDGYFVVNALNRLGATRTMERYLGYIVNIAADIDRRPLQPVFGIDGRRDLDEHQVTSLAGYRGMGPVRVGNLAYRQTQHDVYGSAVLAATHIFFDRRLTRCGDATLFDHLERIGEKAVQSFGQPDAGIWELRGEPRIHTFSSVMCWAACDRLGKIAHRLGLTDRGSYWENMALAMRDTIIRRTWNAQRHAFVATFDGSSMDASLLLLADLGFVTAGDPRFAGTVAAIEHDLKRGEFILRYDEDDGFGHPENAFLVCSFWYVNALASLGRRAEARALFERLLACRNSHGLLAEHVDVATGEPWGNFVQTYSMVGLINSAIRLSIHWDQAF